MRQRMQKFFESEVWKRISKALFVLFSIAQIYTIITISDIAITARSNSTYIQQHQDQFIIPESVSEKGAHFENKTYKVKNKEAFWVLSGQTYYDKKNLCLMYPIQLAEFKEYIMVMITLTVLSCICLQKKKSIVWYTAILAIIVLIISTIVLL